MPQVLDEIFPTHYDENLCSCTFALNDIRIIIREARGRVKNDSENVTVTAKHKDDMHYINHTRVVDVVVAFPSFFN